MDTQELELSVSPEEMCRTCLAAVDHAQLKPIFCSEILDGKIVPFPKVIELTTGEKLIKNEKLPNNVCGECKAKLRDFYVFVEKVRQSANLLYEIFSIDKPKPTLPVRDKTKADTKSTSVQTDFANGSMDKNDQSTASVQLVENETQCDLPRCPTTSFAEVSCQTETITPNKSVQNEVHRSNLDDIKPVSFAPIKKERFTNFTKATLLQTDIDAETLIIEDEDECDMLLLAEEPTVEECYTPYSMSTVKVTTKGGKGTRSTKAATTKRGSSKASVARAVSAEKPEKKPQCLYCSFTYRGDTIQSHIQIHRQTLDMCLESCNYYRCSICFVVVMTRQAFDAHFITACQPVEPEEFREHPDVKKHELFYENGLDVCVPKLKTFILSAEDENYHCGRCSVYSESFEEMHSHAEGHDVEDDQMEDVNFLWKKNSLDKIHVCGICQAQFADALYIRQHVFLHQTSYFCPYDCNVSFEKFRNLTKHIQRTHLETSDAIIAPKVKEPEGQFRCGRCSRKFHSQETLEVHEKRHFRERKYVCTVCRKCFVQKSDLTTHVRIHTNERPYSCDICSKAFRTTSHRRDHMSTHEIVNKYQCDVCQKLFKAERILIGHKRLHTGHKPFQCTICDKTFNRKQHLKLHLKVHKKIIQ